MEEVLAKNYNVKQLRNWLRQLNLPMTGKKDELIQRLNNVPVSTRGECPELHDVTNADNFDDDDEFEEAVIEQSDNNTHISVSQLQAELDVIRKDRELLARELELLKRQNSVSTVCSANITNDIGFSTIKDTIPDFDGTSDVDQWVLHIYNAKKMFSLSDEVLKMLLWCKVKGNAQRWLFSKTDYATVCVNDLITEMCEIFKTQVSKVEQRQKFHQRKWVYNESFIKYYNDKVLLSKNLQIDKVELLEQLIAGITDIQLRNQAKMQCYDSADKLLRAFANIEVPGPSRNRISNTTQRCFNCNSVGHHANDCKKPKREFGACYGCGSLEHRVKDCPDRKVVHLVENVDYVRILKLFLRKDCYFCLSCLIDSGSPISFVRENCLPDKINILECNETYFGLNNSLMNIIGKIFCSYKQTVFVFIVVKGDSMKYEAVIGRDNMNLFGMKLVCSEKEIMIECLVEENYCQNDRIMSDKIDNQMIDKQICETKVRQMSDKRLNDTKMSDIIDSQMVDMQIGEARERQINEYGNNNMNENHVNKNESGRSEAEVNSKLICPEILLIDCGLENKKYKFNDDLSYEEIKLLQNMIENNYEKVEKRTEPLHKCLMKLHLKHDKPFHYTPRRLSVSEKKELQILLDDYLEKGYIRPSDSEYTSPIVLVRKKTGDLRMCVDFRTLNKITEKDNFPIPLIDDLLDSLANKKYFSKLDLKNGYFHVFMDPESIKYTSFNTPLGQFEFNRMLFGLKNAPAVFQRFVNKIFADMLRSEEIIIYMDDIMIATNDTETHFKIL